MAGTAAFTQEQFGRKLDEYVGAVVALLTLDTPDGILVAVDSVCELRQELLRHDAVLRAAEPLR